MNLLLFKLIATPVLIGAVSMAGRRWGPVIGGVLVGLPLTSGPVALFLALGHGVYFASAAAVGILGGAGSVAIFCLAYSWLVFHLPEPFAILAGWVVFFSATWLFERMAVAPLPLFLALVLLFVIVLRLLPRNPQPRRASPPPRWDIPLRMVLATAFVLLLTSLSPLLGPRLSGLLAPFPIFISILGVFAHRLEGAETVVGLVRGVMVGLFAFAAFFLVVALLLVPLGIAATFLLATVVTAIVQGSALWLLRATRARAEREYHDRGLRPSVRETA